MTLTYSSLVLDALILVAEKDYPLLSQCISSVLLYSDPTPRTVYIIYAGKFPPVVHVPPTVPIPEIHVLKETIVYSFISKQAITDHLKARWQTLGLTLSAASSQAYRAASWYWQQLLKLLVFQAFPTIADHVLIFDADARLVRRTTMVRRDGRVTLPSGYPLCWYSFPNNSDSNDKQSKDQLVSQAEAHSHIRHARRLIPGWELTSTQSGMAHGLVVTRSTLTELIHAAEVTANAPFADAFTDAVNSTSWNAASEYVIYHHFAMRYFPGQHVVVPRVIVDAIIQANGKVALSKLSFMSAENLINWFYDRWSSDGMASKPNVNWKEVDQVGLHSFKDAEQRLNHMDYFADDDLQEKAVRSLRARGVVLLCLNATGEVQLC